MYKRYFAFAWVFVTLIVLGLSTSPAASQDQTATAVATAGLAATEPAIPDFGPTATQVASAPHQTVTSPDGRVTLLIPQGALPANVAPSSIKIITLKPANAPLSFDGKPPLSAYQLEPDGLHFTTPAVIRVTVDQPADGGVPMLFTVSGQNVEPLSNNTVEFDPKNPQRIILTAPITHFSEVFTDDGLFRVDTLYRSKNAIGDAFYIFATVTVWNPSGTIVLFNIPGLTINLVYAVSDSSVRGAWAAPQFDPEFVPDDRLISTFANHWYNKGTRFVCLPPPGTRNIIYHVELSYNLSISIDQSGAVVQSQSTVTKTWNHDITQAITCVPLISKFTAKFVQAEFSTHYTVQASDPDGDPLTYHWSKTQVIGKDCGVFSWDSTKPEAVWAHPDAPKGNCPNEAVHPATIAVTVSDVFGASQTVTYTGGSGDGTLSEKDIPYAP